MDGFLLASLVILVFLAIYSPALPAAWRTYRRFREPEALVCPATGYLTAIQYNAGAAAVSMLFRGRPSLRVRNCGDWPEQAGCDQRCLNQVR